MRSVLSVVVGLAAAIGIFVIAEQLNSSLHPTPPGLDLKDPVAVKTFYENQPLSMWLMVLVGWAVGSLVCGFLIRLLSKSSGIRRPLIAGGILTLSAVANFFALPHPAWFIVVGLLIFIPATLIGHKLYRPRS